MTAPLLLKGYTCAPSRTVSSSKRGRDSTLPTPQYENWVPDSLQAAYRPMLTLAIRACCRIKLAQKEDWTPLRRLKTLSSETMSIVGSIRHRRPQPAPPAAEGENIIAIDQFDETEEKHIVHRLLVACLSPRQQTENKSYGNWHGTSWTPMGVNKSLMSLLCIPIFEKEAC